jgi:hypothetical protein
MANFVALAIAAAQNKAAPVLSGKIAQACANLKPFQTIEYDPATNTVLIVTELLVPSPDVNQLVEILAHRRADEKVTIKRFAEHYKIALTRGLKV